MHRSNFYPILLVVLPFFALTFAQDGWTTAIDVEVGGTSVKLEGDINSNDIFWSVWSQRGEKHFNTTAVPISNTGCSISYDGHGDESWFTTNGMAKTLVTTVGPQVISKTHYTTRGECSSWDFPEKGPGHCAKYDEVVHPQTVVLTGTKIFVSNQPPQYPRQPASDQGDMTYNIVYPSPAGPNCLGCKATKIGLSALSLIPDIGVAFGAGNVVLSAGCLMGNCG